MNKRLLLSAMVLGAFGHLPASSQSAAGPGQGAREPAAATDAMLEVYGWFLGQQMELYSFGFSDAELAAVARGISSAARGEESSADLEEVGPALQQFLGARPAEVQERRKQAGLAEQQAYFAELDQKPAVKKTATGLRYEIVAPGPGPKPALSSTVIAHYTGRFIDGKVFDSSVNRGEPAEFPLNGVIAGWQEGLQLIGVGGRIKLYIPGELAYGDTGRANIPPAKTLIFDVELLEIKSEPPSFGPSPSPSPSPATP